MNGQLQKSGEENGMEDSRIVDLYLARDESAIKHSAEKYGARLHGISLGIVNDPRHRRGMRKRRLLRSVAADPAE